MTTQLEKQYEMPVKIFDMRNGFVSAAIYETGKDMLTGNYIAIITARIVNNKIYKGVQI